MLHGVLLAAFVGCASPVRAEAISVSSSLEQHLDALLADILGPGRARAFVRLVHVPADSDDAAEDRGARPTALWDRLEARLGAAPPVLPGFSAPRSLRDEAVRELVREERSPAEREALDVTLVVDGSVSEAALRTASDAVARAVGLDAARGDSLRAARAPLAPTWSKTWSDIVFSAPASAARAAVAVGVLSLLAALWALGSLARRRLSGKRLLPGPSEGPPFGLAGPSPAPRTQLSSDLPFDIQPDQVPSLIELLQGHPPEHAALVVPHLRADAREALLSAMSPDEAAAVLAAMVRLRPVDPGRIRLLRARLERRLGRTVGGAPRAAEALRTLPRTKRSAIVARLWEADAEAAAALQADASLEEPGSREAD